MKRLTMGMALSVCAMMACSNSGGAAGTAAGAATNAPSAQDQELARLLVKLELKTRAVIGAHYKSADEEHRDWMAQQLILPAAVADSVFHSVVANATDGRAWVRMVVDEPRNEHNRGDDVAMELLKEIKAGAPHRDRSAGGAYYYAEPIKSVKTCLACHGDSRGAADPFFPQYEKNGWREGQIVGAVIARVAPADATH